MYLSIYLITDSLKDLKEKPLFTAFYCHTFQLHKEGRENENQMQSGGEISVVDCSFITQGELAQMVERSLSMREVAGSMPAFSRVLLTLYCLLCGGKCLCSDCRTQTMSLGR